MKDESAGAPTRSRELLRQRAFSTIARKSRSFVQDAEIFAEALLHCMAQTDLLEAEVIRLRDENQRLIEGYAEAILDRNGSPRA